MSKGPLPTTPTASTKAVHHFHYHYFLPHPSPKCTSPAALKRVRSDIKLRPTPAPTDNTDAQSNSSRQSWKDAINPEYQKADPNPRNFKATSPSQKTVESLRKQYSHRSKRVDTTESLHSTPRVFQQRQRFSSTLLQAKKQSESQPSSEPFFGCLPDLQLPPSSPNTPFLKKRQPHVLNAALNAALTARETAALTDRLTLSPRNHSPTYREQLLEEQCRFLRDRFLLHFQRGHPEITRSSQ